MITVMIVPSRWTGPWHVRHSKHRLGTEPLPDRCRALRQRWRQRRGPDCFLSG